MTVQGSALEFAHSPIEHADCYPLFVERDAQTREFVEDALLVCHLLDDERS